MSISSVSGLSILEQSLLQSEDATGTSAQTAASASSRTQLSQAASTDTDTDLAAASSGRTTLTSDLTSLLRSLVSGDIGSARNALTQLQADLKAQGATPENQSASPGTATTTGSNSLTRLAEQVSQSLSAGSTTGALQNLASYLVSTGLGSGTLVNTTA